MPTRELQPPGTRQRPVLPFWRFLLAFAVGVALGFAVLHFCGDDDHELKAVAFVLGLAGQCVGVAWELVHRWRR